MVAVHLEGLSSQYQLEEDPDILTLCRTDGSWVAVFSTDGADPDAIRRAAEEDASGGASGTDGKTPLPEGVSARATLQVRFLGSFELLYGGALLPACRSTKARTIIKYLLANEGRPLSRDFLMGWLWPDANLKKARWSLNTTIHTLRRFLMKHLPLKYGEEIILYEEGSYRLHHTWRIESDVGEFDERYAHGRRLEEDGNMFKAATEYDAAVRLYRGDYLLEDLYEDWTMIERERITNVYIYMLERLVAHYTSIGHYQCAIEVCYRILEKSPCREDIHLWLINHYANIGQREQALSQYQACVRALKSRYGLEPSPNTLSAYRNIVADAAAER